MRCFNCGFENPEKSKFCGKCGKALVQEGIYGKEEKIMQLSYKKLLRLVAVALGILLLGYWLIAPNITNVLKILEPASAPVSTSPNPMTTKTVETSTPTSQSLAGGASPTPTKVAPASKTIILEPIDKESSGYSSGGSCCGRYVGDDSYDNYYYQTFLSYSMAGIPANATITEATLDFSTYGRNGDPFSYLGCLGVYEQFFGAPDAKDFFLGTPTDAIAKWCTDGELSSPLKSKNLASALQNKLGKNRFQIRLQFDTNTNNNKQGDSISVRSAKIIVTYNVP